MTDRHPATESDLQREHEVFTPGTMEQYALWVESHITAGGRVWRFEDAEAAAQWQARALFAGEDFVLGGEEGKHARNILIADGVTYSGDKGSNALYSFDDPDSSSGWDVPVFAVPQFKELVPLFEEDFRKAFAFSMVCDIDPEVLFHGSALRVATLDRYFGMAALLGITIDQREVDDYDQEAQAQRVAKQQEMATPEYRAGQAAAMEALTRATLASVHAT